MAEIRGGFVSGQLAFAMTIKGQEEVIAAFRQVAQEQGKMVVEIRSANQSLQETSRSVMSYGRALGTVRGFITQVSISSFVFFLLQRRLRSSAEAVRRTQDQLNETIQRHGRLSDEARDAMERLRYAQEEARMAQVEFGIQMIFFISSTAHLLAQLPQLISALGVLKTALLGVASAGALANISLGPIGLAALAGAGIAIGAVYLMGGLGGGSPEQQFDRQWDEAGRYVKQRAFRQSRRYG